MRSPPTSWAIDARSCVVVMTFNLPCARTGDAARQTAATSAGIEIMRRICCLLEGVCTMSPDRELQLEEQLVGHVIAVVDRAPVLAAHLAELARPERQRCRAAPVPQRE